MILRSDPITEFACLVVMACWLGFGAILIIGRRDSAAASAKRDLKSHAGFALQSLAYALLFVFSRTYFSPWVPMPRAAEVITGTVTALIAVCSDWFCFVAARTLGKQWSLVARVIAGHELIQQGPYAIVRNPIYLAMLGMLVATGLAVSSWEALLVATILFLVGSDIRIRSEEQLLREAFGREFEEYARRVPAFLPRIW
jgi:protein-S-isoprenylcysteine O-methyltransferase Ste14